MAIVTRARNDEIAGHSPKPSNLTLPAGSRFCKCTACGEYFSGERPFDSHRTASWESRRWLTVDEMGALGE